MGTGRIESIGKNRLKITDMQGAQGAIYDVSGRCVAASTTSGFEDFTSISTPWGTISLKGSISSQPAHGTAEILTGEGEYPVVNYTPADDVADFTKDAIHQLLRRPALRGLPEIWKSIP